jgi:hypothetical protein
MNRGVVRHARAYIAGIDVFLRAGVAIRSSIRTRHQAACNLADVTRLAHDFVEVGAHDAPEPRQRDRRLALKQRAARSSAPMALVSEGCEMPQRRVKLSSSHSVRK